MRLASALVFPLFILAAFPATGTMTMPQPVGSAPHDRVLPLQGGQNFRDLGGYRTADGRTVRWGLLFRSGSMHFLTPADYTYLESRGIRTVCDLRSTEERQSEPSSWPTPNAPQIFADDYSMASLSAGLGLKAGEQPTAEGARKMMTATYPQMLVRFNGQYRRMFGEMLAGRVPLAFNCSAGKDRTGVAAALVLTALGVRHKVVVEDYLLTNRYFDPQKVVHNSTSSSASFQKMPPDVLKAYMIADPNYIEAALDVVEQHAGGVKGYLHDELGLSDTDIAKMRAMYTR